MFISAGLDLGTTVIKAGTLNDDGSLSQIISVKAPSVTASGLLMESDPEDYFNSASSLFEQLTSDVPDDIPIGIASQRSSFLLWDRVSGAPITPLISWEDRRSDKWCRAHRDIEDEHLKRTGLLMSPHYPASKIAHIFDQDPSLKERAETLMFGQIDTYCMWRWCKEHIVDLTMAARTLLVESDLPGWSDYMLNYFGVPREILPKVVPTYMRSCRAEGRGIITASISDQASALELFRSTDEEYVLVNIGTGAFVMASTGQTPRYSDGLLTGPSLMLPDGSINYALEGTVNGVANALLGMDIDSVILAEDDSLKDCYCIPDTAGIGAPFWQSSSDQVWSCDPDNLNETEKCQLVLEGVIFRIVHIIQCMYPDGGVPSVYASGGLSNCEFLRVGLASCLNVDVLKPLDAETTLLGVARLASGKLDFEPPPTIIVPQSECLSYLKDKQEAWVKWVLATPRCPINKPDRRKCRSA